MKMEHIECSETSGYKIETPGNCPKKTHYIALDVTEHNAVSLNCIPTVSNVCQQALSGYYSENMCVWKRRVHHISHKMLPLVLF